MYFATTATHKVAAMKARIRVVSGGTSASKTISILLLLIQYAQQAGHKDAKKNGWPESPVIISIVAESLPHLKKAAMRDFLEILNAQKVYQENRWSKTDFLYTFETGSRIEFFGVEDSSKVRGPRRDVLFINEANNISYETFDQLLVRTNHVCYIDFNPVGEFWFHTEVKNTRTDWEEIVLTYKDNEALSPGIIADIEQHKNRPGWWKVYGLGQLGDVEGKVYSGWGIINEIPHEARLERYGLDFGFSNDPAALISIYYYNGGYILDEEFCQVGMKNREIADYLKNKPRALVVADSAEPKSIAEIKEYGINILPCVKKGAKGIDYKRYSIQTVQDLKISVTRSSATLLKEYRNYLWAVDRDGKLLQNETEGADHCLDAARYGLTSLASVIRRRELLQNMSSQFPPRKRHNIAV